MENVEQRDMREGQRSAQEDAAGRSETRVCTPPSFRSARWGRSGTTLFERGSPPEEEEEAEEKKEAKM